MKNILSAKNILIFLLLGANSLSIYTNYQNKLNSDSVEKTQLAVINDLKDSNLKLKDEADKYKDAAKSDTEIKLPSTIVFDVPKYKQTHNASCEAAAAHAAMSYFGVVVNEDKIIEEVGMDTSKKTVDKDGTIRWGNPQLKFVGDVDAEKVYVDGYGVYNEPIYKILASHGFSKSVSKMEWELEELYTYIKQGYPVIIWISNDYKTKKTSPLIAEDGSVHKFMIGEHAVVIRGVDEKNVYVMDVGGGDYQTITKEKFATGFANLDNMAIAVIPD